MVVIENKDGVTDWNGQDFLELELGPVYLRLGSDGGPPRVWKVPMSPLRNVEELLAVLIGVGTNCATPGSGDT